MVRSFHLRHEPGEGVHTIEIFGNLAEMLANAHPALAESYRAVERSLKLVAGDVTPCFSATGCWNPDHRRDRR